VRSEKIAPDNITPDNITEDMPKDGPVIAIDGPAGTGKSSVTRRLAELLHFVHVDTGALYRAIAYLVLKAKHEYSKTLDPAVVARETRLSFRRIVEMNPSNRIFADGEDITDHIRTPEVTQEASRVSAIPLVRAALLGLQRKLGCHGRTILEGRDIGTVVFPDADVKFFLTASLDERAKRRLIELETVGVDVPSFEEVKSLIPKRDENDTHRKVAPLRKAQDAIELDTSGMTLDQVVQTLEALVRERLKKQ